MQPHTPLFDPYEFTKTEIQNVPVYWKNLPSAPCIHIHITFYTGAYSDPVGKEGLSHFLEHMIFDGSPQFPDKKAVKEWSKKYTLGSWNAFTSAYQTTYHARCLPEEYKPMLYGMKEMIFSPLLKNSDVEHEREVITQEAWRAYHNEKLLVYTRYLTSQMFPGHNLSRNNSILGWPETIATMSVNDIRQWHGEKYKKGNFFITLVGNVQTTHIEHIEQFLSDLPRGYTQTPLTEQMPAPLLNEITKTADEIGLVKEKAELDIVAYRNTTSTIANEHRFAFTNLLRDILHEKLRDEKALCYAVNVFGKHTADYVMYSIHLETSEEHIKTACEEIAAQIKIITQTNTYAERFTQLEKNAFDRIRSEECTSDEVIENAVRELVKTGTIQTQYDSLLARKAVTYADMQKAGVYLTDPAYTVTEIILPSKK